MRRVCEVTDDAEALLSGAMSQLLLSARGHDRILKVARTLADMAGHSQIAAANVAEAIQYRALDRRLSS